MNKIIFEEGDEKKALDFLRNISAKDKVAIVTHTDLDGVSAGKVIFQFVSSIASKENTEIFFIDYSEMELITEKVGNDFNKIIFSDLNIDYPNEIKKISDNSEILIIDHHIFDESLNSDKVIFMNVKGYCASYLCYYLVSQLKEIKDISGLDWLVACASVADFQFFNNQEFMKEVYEKYGDKFEVVGDFVRKNGKIYELENNLSYSIIYFKAKKNLYDFFDILPEDINNFGEVLKYSNIVKEEIENQMEKFENEKENFGDWYFWKINTAFSVGGMIATFLSLKEINKTFIITREEEGHFKVGARRQDGKVNLSDILKKAVEGIENSNAGGHAKASGATVPVRDIDLFKENLKKLL